MTLATRYTPQTVEGKWYKHWMDKNYFHSEPDEREAFSIVIPPPNVTGLLHMGHMLNITIQDILVRKARLEGKNACWVPGTDHASIATEAKVVKMLREKGIKKSDLTRDEFMKYAWEWKEKYGGIILQQLQKLGASCDWERTRFTLEDSLSKAVTTIFVDLHGKGKLYRGLRMTNWDPQALTVLSNEEVIYTEEQSKLYHVRYKVADTTDEWVTIATTRPETILGDSGVAVHPKDERYTHLKGKKVIVPIVNRTVPIIFDTYVEMEFGTGCLKVTPAHDMNDYDIGQRHDLETIDILNANGSMSEAAQFYIGTDRFKARKLIVKDLKEAGHIVEIEDYTNKVGRSERTNAIIEPRLTKQWFVDMKQFAKTALDAVKNEEVKFYPSHFFNMYHNWLNEDNVRDWCISRQLWWGHRIPAWYYKDDVFVATTAEEALAKAAKKTGNNNLSLTDLQQDEDALDTWFSSWLWPISVFNGFENQDELKYYYPTNVLVTGWDIMFFWVARMIMAGYEWGKPLLGEDFVKNNGTQPFNTVFFTGMVRDKQRRKMSKQLGNSPDAINLIDKYGADGVRFGMLSSAAAGNDIVFDAPIDKKQNKVLDESDRCGQGLNFANKIWHANRMLKGLQIVEKPQNKDVKALNELAGQWFENKLNKTLSDVENSYKEYRLSDVVMGLYNFIWNDFFSWYLEIIKPEYGQPIDQKTYDQTITFFETLMTILHPIMPFVTEEIWHELKERTEGEDCIMSTYPSPGSYDKGLLKAIETTQDLVSKVREIRQKNALKKSEPLKLFVEKGESANEFYQLKALDLLVKKMAVLDSLTFVENEPENSVNFIAGTEKYYIEINKTIDVEAERARIEKELVYHKGFLVSVDKKLGNARFVDNAPTAVVDMERKKQADALTKIKILEESLAKMAEI